MQAALLALRAGQEFKLRVRRQQPSPPGSPGGGSGAAPDGGQELLLWFRPAESPQLEPHQPAIAIPPMPGPGRTSGGETPPTGNSSFELMPGTPTTSAADRPASKGRPAYYFALVVPPRGGGSAAGQLQAAPAPPEQPALARRRSLSCKELPALGAGSGDAAGGSAAGGGGEAAAPALRRVSVPGAPRRNPSVGSLQSMMLTSQVRGALPAVLAPQPVGALGSPLGRLHAGRHWHRGGSCRVGGAPLAQR